MKKIYTYIAFLLLVLLSACGSSQTLTQGYNDESQEITYQQFYDGLSPYGNWVNYQDYGYVWQPNEQNFRPYYNNGHWVYTNYGWTWVSGYDWGWAPFHYGRWLYDDAYGWMWVPGYQWAPAWVSWRDGNDCYGWAPLGPGMNYGGNSSYRIPDNNWAFVPRRYINSPRINNYYINRERNVTIINNTTVINNTNLTVNKTVYVTGPAATEVETVTNQKIRPVRIVQKTTPGTAEVSGSTVSMYKPGVKELPQQNSQVRPSRIVNVNELKMRRQNTGAAQNEIPGKEVQGNSVPAETKPQPVLNPPKDNVPAVNQQTNPVGEKQIQAQPQRDIPVQQGHLGNPTIINREKNNDEPVQNNQPNTPVTRQPPVINKQPTVINRQPAIINKQPAVINNQPAIINNQPSKVRVINRPNRNPANVHDNVTPAPINRQPVKTQQNNIPRPQPQRLAPVNRPANTPPVIHTPIIRNPNAAESPGAVRQLPGKEK